MRASAALSFSLLSGACFHPAQEDVQNQTRATYEKFLIPAATGDAGAQNLIGFMLFFGESVAEDKQEAHYWFHLAAEQGDGAAQLNLAIMHGLGQDAALDHNEAQRMYAAYQAVDDNAPPTLADAMATMGDEGSRDTPPGRRNFETFCAGCHGLNGVARYVVSPSFAIGERLEKSDAELLQSIAWGKGTMPGWDSKISELGMRQILAYIRTFNDRYRKGVAGVLRSAPEQYFTFGPMVDKPFELEEPGAAAAPPPQ